MRKKLVSFILVLCMFMTMFPSMSLAAEEPSATLKIVPDQTSVVTSSGEVEITYTISVVPKDGVKIGSISFYLVPPEGVTLGEYEDNATLGYHKVYNPDGIFEYFNGYDERSKLFSAAGTTSERCLTSETKLMTIKAKVAEGTTGDLKLDVHTLSLGDVLGYVYKDAILSSTVVQGYSEITGDQSIAITAPVKGATPQTDITEGSGYTGVVTWTPAVSSSSSDVKFAANTAYTAKVTLTAKDYYKFAADDKEKYL